MSSPTSFNTEERARKVRQLTQQAIQHALQSRWDEAVATNQELLRVVQRNTEVLNRLGKALFELGRYAEAKKSYSESLQIDPNNNIARKNLDRLALLGDQAAPDDHAAERIDPRLFIEEIGKTGVTNLVNLARREALAKLTAGDQVYLHVEGNALFVRNARGENLGQVEPILANRLIRFINGGNRYAAAITDATDGLVRIIIRETFQDPRQIGKVSFLSHGPGALPSSTGRDQSAREDEDTDDDDEEEGDEQEEEFDEAGDSAEESERGGDSE